MVYISLRGSFIIDFFCPCSTRRYGISNFGGSSSSLLQEPAQVTPKRSRAEDLLMALAGLGIGYLLMLAYLVLRQ
jgi:hypothetical protein